MMWNEEVSSFTRSLMLSTWAK
ncbi:MAG: hypothetical protein RLZZ580_1833, partial [Cyanobacteriota bacterium]